MSRTKRCKNLKTKHLATREQFEETVKYRRHHIQKPTFEEAQKAEIAKSHTDGGWKYYWQGTVPGHIVNLYDERPWRRSVKAEIHRYLAKGGEDGPVFRKPKMMKKAAWYFY